jgi:phage tail-like protein
MPQATSAGEIDNIYHVGSWFNVEIEGLTVAAFTDVSGLAIELNVVEINDSNKDTATRKTPGVAKYGEITLKRKLTPDKTFWTWAKSIRSGESGFRKNGSVVLFDMSGAEVGRWNFTNAWPSKWSASDLDVGTDDPVDEEVTLAIEFLERIS